MSDKETVIALNRYLGNPFTFYMDAVMRGRFKAYSGPEVKGINIVNLFLCEGALPHEHAAFEEVWSPLLNTYQRNVTFDFERLGGTREEQIGILIDVFTQHAEDSLLPQMQTLVRHIKESKGKTSIDGAIQRGDDYLRALRERVQQRQQNATGNA
jgi:hypothetical protein